MFTTIITDCSKSNEAGRQITRFNSLGLGPATLIEVGNYLNGRATIEAAGNLIDTLDASAGEKGVIVANVAPRGNGKDENGTLFSYFYQGSTLVIATIGGYTLSLLKQFRILSHVSILSEKDVLNEATKKNLISEKKKDYILNSQFRSYDFVPLIAKWLLDGVELPSKRYRLDKAPDIPSCIWCIDAFGNCKTTITKDKIPSVVKTSIGKFTFYHRLKDVPKGEIALYTGSSGINDSRFVEIAKQGSSGSAEKALNLKIGDMLQIM